MTIFGFNTDVQHEGTVYHVQSEARQQELLLQTMVFVKGQCMAKRVRSYAQLSLQPEFSEQAMHELLKAQHKAGIDSVMAGRMETELGIGSEVQDVGGDGLALKWTRSSPENLGSSLIFHIQALDNGQPVNGAFIAVFPCTPLGDEAMTHCTTDSEGKAAIPVPLTANVETDSAVLIRATHEGKSATRKFKFRK
jgi:hypothetical protein